MKINIEAYENLYHDADGKLRDEWQKGIKLLPFIHRTNCAFDKKCGLYGTTGEFFRLWDNDGTKAIEDFEVSAVKPVEEYLSINKQMPSDQVKEFVCMMKDIMLVNGNLNISDTAFLKYLPLVPNDEGLSEKNKNDKKNGVLRLGTYLYSMLSDEMQSPSHHARANLFSRILEEALMPKCSIVGEKQKREYYILPYIKKSFEKDLKWMLEQEEAIKIKYLHLLLHFYVCYSVTQTIVMISAQKQERPLAPAPFYFILNSEKASVNHDAVLRGWSFQITKDSLNHLFGKIQALDILNSVLGGNVGFYADVMDKLRETNFETNRALCNELLWRYQAEKHVVFEGRKSEDASIEKEEIDVSSYKGFVSKLEHLCTGLQSPSYISRMRKNVIDLLSVRFLQCRRGNYVLVLDNEMLTFLAALFTKGQKTKLEDMYKQFNNYGIFFNRGSRMAIEEYLLKLNLLDRKSDSGEAQYVTVVL